MPNKFSSDVHVDMLLERAACCGEFVFDNVQSNYVLVSDIVGDPLFVEWYSGQAFYGKKYDDVFVKRAVGDNYLWMLDRYLGCGRFEVVDRRFLKVFGVEKSDRKWFVLPEDDFGFQFALVWEWLVRWYFDKELVEIDEEAFDILYKSRFICWYLDDGDLETWMGNVLGGGVDSEYILLEIDLWGNDDPNQFEFC